MLEENEELKSWLTNKRSYFDQGGYTPDQIALLAIAGMGFPLVDVCHLVASWYAQMARARNLRNSEFWLHWVYVDMMQRGGPERAGPAPGESPISHTIY